MDPLIKVKYVHIYINPPGFDNIMKDIICIIVGNCCGAWSICLRNQLTVKNNTKYLH